MFNTNSLIFIKGDAGTGKTTLINTFLEQLDEEAYVANITFPVTEKLDFLNLVANKLNIEIKLNDKMDFLIHFKRLFNNCRSENKKVILIIDEAHRLNQDVLEQIKFLLNAGRQYAEFLKIIFSGQDEFFNILSAKDNQDLRNKLTANYHIRPLKDTEIGKYILHRLKVAGNEENIFSAGAMSKIFSFSKGYPRLINVICDHALSAGYVKGVKTIDAKTIKECADGLRISIQRINDNQEQEILEQINKIEKEPAIKSSVRTLKPVLLLAITVIIFSFFYYQGKFGKHIGNIKKYFGNGLNNRQKSTPIDMPQIRDTNKKIYPVVQDSQEPQKTSVKQQQIDSNAANLTSEAKMPDEKKQADQKLLSLPHAEKTKLEQIDSNAAHLTSEAKMPDEKKQADQKLLSLPHVEKTKLAMDQDRLQAGRYTVYLHYASKENKELIEGLAVSLKNKGFKVLGIERVDYKISDIRYFHNGDKAGALLLQKYSTEFITLNTNLKATNIRIKDFSQEYPNAQKGALELWINL